MVRVPLGLFSYRSSPPNSSYSSALPRILAMASKHPSDNYVHTFHASVRKVASGPTFLHFASSTPPDQVVSAVPTLLREFRDKESRYALACDRISLPALLIFIRSATKVKPDPDTVSSRLPSSQDPRVKRSCSAAPITSKREATPGVSLGSSTRASSMPLPPDSTYVDNFIRAGSASRAGSLGPSRVIKANANEGSRPGNRVQFIGGSASSASRAPTPRLPPQPEDFDEPPILAPPSVRITRSSSRTIHSPKSKPASPSLDPSLAGITAPEPMDPNVRATISFGWVVVSDHPFSGLHQIQEVMSAHGRRERTQPQGQVGTTRPCNCVVRVRGGASSSPSS